MNEEGAMNDLHGKVALVTGGARSLGAGIAGAFLRAGASVVVADIDAQAGEALAARLRTQARSGQTAGFVRTNLAEDADLVRLVESLDREFGRLDCLVNNACIYDDAGLASTREQWLRSLTVNVVSGALLVGHAVPLLRRTERPAVVNLSSVAGKVGQLGRLLYPACKAAILQVTRSMAVNLAPEGIRVNAVTPAWTWSEALVAQVAGDRELADRVASTFHPLARVGNIEDVAAAVLFLCSGAAGFVTGADLPVDGGYAVLGPDQGRSPAYWFQAARQPE